jgi:hypothetical protein
MRRIKCPKCDNYIVFDETKYTLGQALVFKCKCCKAEFGIKIGQSKLNEIHEEKKIDNHQFDSFYGAVVIIENKFTYKQIIQLQLGDNFLGRYLKGNDINSPIITSDPSVDTLHCIINVKLQNNGKLLYTIRDANSNTGTFCMNTLLEKNERRIIDDGTIINIGATTMVLYEAVGKSN